MAQVLDTVAMHVIPFSKYALVSNETKSCEKKHCVWAFLFLASSFCEIWVLSLGLIPSEKCPSLLLDSRVKFKTSEGPLWCPESVKTSQRSSQQSSKIQRSRKSYGRFQKMQTRYTLHITVWCHILHFPWCLSPVHTTHGQIRKKEQTGYIGGHHPTLDGKNRTEQFGYSQRASADALYSYIFLILSGSGLPPHHIATLNVHVFAFGFVVY